MLGAELPRAKVADEVGERLEVVWNLAAQPLLFGVAGAAVSFPALPHMAAVKCLFAALIGVFLRSQYLPRAGSKNHCNGIDFHCAQVMSRCACLFS